MKLIQQAMPKFEPIAVVLETREEAELFWRMIRGSYADADEQRLANKISDYFSNEAKL